MREWIAWYVREVLRGLPFVLLTCFLGPPALDWWRTEITKPRPCKPWDTTYQFAPDSIVVVIHECEPEV